MELNDTRHGMGGKMGLVVGTIKKALPVVWTRPRKPTTATKTGKHVTSQKKKAVAQGGTLKGRSNRLALSMARPRELWDPVP